MHLFAALNFVQANGYGDVYLVAAGVFLGNLAWGILLGMARWSMARGKNRELEEAIVKALAKRDAETAISPTPASPT
jgi:hypothetical protein